MKYQVIGGALHKDGVRVRWADEGHLAAAEFEAQLQRARALLAEVYELMPIPGTIGSGLATAVGKFLAEVPEEK